ncbi:MAG: hypothetical protein KA100_03365 [Rickettsiales bacterium]|nr:hypothetical protein [Rickettsiales bacterium]
MTEKSAKTPEVKEFKPIKKLSPFVSDPFNTRGGKGGNKGVAISTAAAGVQRSSVKSSIKKGGSGDR